MTKSVPVKAATKKVAMANNSVTSKAPAVAATFSRSRAATAGAGAEAVLVEPKLDLLSFDEGHEDFMFDV